ncbi:MAG: MarR family transcriptional regulator [Candidatus Omnitrophica bacterium]|nr:MarR family transcriptional regulator [Candidatus Omnitrophota bacterium]MBU4488716.1 MarR family transcriptional regulator [Candidatus Omnitrophota bacterium]MCG2705745.1 MarR family transcriptional regulator [Candidatus Omnitrophota bacterium]
MAGMPISEFADRINEIMPLIMRNFLRQQTKEFYKTKITIPQFGILDYLSREGELKMTDISKMLNVTTAAVTGIVDKLVRYGYVMRKPDTEDRRIIKVKITAKGNDIVRKMIEHRRQMIINMFDKISEKEREEYLGILNHIKEHLTE